MELGEVFAFMRQHRYGVVASVSADGRPSAATVGIVVTDTGDVIFDTVETTRKAEHLRRNPAIAITVGSLEADASTTVQYEGIATFPEGADLEATRAAYLGVFPDGAARLHWPGIVHVRVRPRWIRYSTFATDPPRVHEFRLAGEG